MTTHLALHQDPAGTRQARPIHFAQRPVPSAQETLDRITCLAGEALDVPAACVSLLDVQGRLMTSGYGLPLSTALLVSHAFRKHVSISGHPLVVADGRRDPMVAHNPAVRDGTVRACVVMPLGMPDGRARGTLIVLDSEPREWTAQQLDVLETLGALIVSEVVLGTVVPRALRPTVPAEITPIARHAPIRRSPSTHRRAFARMKAITKGSENGRV